jgi:uncharacterized CHY-type Zn-finger protein
VVDFGTLMNKVGKIGRINIKANRKLVTLFNDKDIYRCELCQSPFMLSFAHRHKRIFYRSKPELLSDFNQVALLCAKCHNEIEYNKEYTKETFMKLRGEELDYDKI